MRWTQMGGLGSLVFVTLLGCPPQKAPVAQSVPIEDSAVPSEPSSDSGGQVDSGDSGELPGPEDSGGPPVPPLSTEALEWYLETFPTAVGVLESPIPADLLMPDDVEASNVTVSAIMDEDRQTLGYARRVFTDVGCAAGVCEAIDFIVLHEPGFAPLDVFHPPGLEFRLMKYWEGEYLEFDESEMATLRSHLIAPPSVFTAVEEEADLVEGTHGTAPTRPEFEDWVIRGAAFTTYSVVDYGIQTQVILHTMYGSTE